MTTTIISNTPQYSYGMMTNQTIARLLACQANLERLKDAITTASAGYTGTPGTEFELVPIMAAEPGMPNLFGIQPSATAGEQGAAYKYAMSRLSEEWAKFWAVAEPFVNQLDNGGSP